jgi:surface antigen
VSDEQTPDPMANLLSAADATPQSPAALVPAAPQYSSRREARDAAARSAKRPVASAQQAVVVTPKGPKSRSPKLSRKDRALARKLAVAPREKAAPTTSAKPTKRQNPALVIFVLLVVSGFVGGVALPAYAFTPVAPGSVATAAKTTPRDLQDLKVDATIDAAAVSRNDVSAMSDAEYKQQQITAASLLAYARVGPHQAGDDYPWATAGNSLSPLGYYYRQCVDFVAWRLNRDAGVTAAPWKWTWSNLTPGGGDASQWKSAWEAHGWATSATPVIGAVAWFVGNHVAYVKSIDGANVTIEEYNGMSSRSYAIRTIAISSVGRFLYPPPK